MASMTLNLLRREHAQSTKLREILERQIACFGAGEAVDYVIILGVIEYCLEFPDQCDHPEEDLIIRKLWKRNAAAAQAFGDLEGEHANLAGLTREFAAAVRRVLSGAELPRPRIMVLAKEFIDTYRQHMKMEEVIFIPAAKRALTSQDWAEIDARMVDRSHLLSAEQINEEFQTLRDYVYELGQAA